LFTLFSGVFDGANEGALARKDKPRAKTIPVNRPEDLAPTVGPI